MTTAPSNLGRMAGARVSMTNGGVRTPGICGPSKLSMWKGRPAPPDHTVSPLPVAPPEVARLTAADVARWVLPAAYAAAGPMARREIVVASWRCCRARWASRVRWGGRGCSEKIIPVGGYTTQVGLTSTEWQQVFGERSPPGWPALRHPVSLRLVWPSAPDPAHAAVVALLAFDRPRIPDDLR